MALPPFAQVGSRINSSQSHKTHETLNPFSVDRIPTPLQLSGYFSTAIEWGFCILPVDKVHDIEIISAHGNRPII